MQTWHIRVVAASGAPLTQTRALARYAVCCATWFGPATLLAWAMQLKPWPSLGLTAAGIVGYALLALAAPGHQFWHDRLCGTRLIDWRRSNEPGDVRPRPR